MARFLDVYLGTDLVGLLEQDGDGALWFEYEVAWLANPAAVPISASLPLREERFKRNGCRPYFAGLLPEETSRMLVSQALGVSERNDFSILERIGAECAGAASLWPKGETPVFGRQSYRGISETEFAAKLAAVPKHPLMAGDEGIRLSLAGAQGKIALMIRDGKYFLPLEGSPSTHILKPQSQHFEGLVENEYFCMKLAAHIGLHVATVEICEAGGQGFLQIARYDRMETGDGILQRIHQEDFCQALGIPPEMKYQQEGGPNLKQCFELVRVCSSAPGPDLLKLFDAVVFNYLIGNCDAHRKNFSFVYGESGCRLAPLYDLVCTRAYPDISAVMAMKIGGEKDPDRVSSKDWEKFISDVGMGRTAAFRRLQYISERTSTVLGSTEDDSTVTELVARQCGRIKSLKLK